MPQPMAEIFCKAGFNYAGTLGPQRVEVNVLNGRHFSNPGWRQCGFELMNHRSFVTDWNDDQQIQDVHYEEISAFARKLTGCKHAIVGGHISRNPEQAGIHHDLGPISLVHSDFTETYGDRMLRFYSEQEPSAGKEPSTDINPHIGLKKAGITGADVSAAKRMLILQFWRNVGPAKMDMPLAFCDATTVPREDLRSFPVNNYAGGGFDFDAYSITAPMGHSHDFYVYPEMNIDEVVVFRTFDSQCVDRGEAFWTPHSAFRDPSVKEGEPSRYSIELRATCLFY